MGQRWTHYKVEHLWYFTPRSLTDLLVEAGFSLATLRSAPKKLSLDYAIHQFRVYPHPVISSALLVLDRLLPRAAKSLRFTLPLGDMLVQAVAKPLR
jgi:hypothetical protein